MLFKLTDCTAERSKSIFWRKNNLETATKAISCHYRHRFSNSIYFGYFTRFSLQFTIPSEARYYKRKRVLRRSMTLASPILVSQKTEREGSGGLFCSDNSTVSVALILPSKFLQFQEYNSWRTDFWNLGRAPKKKGNYFRFQDWLVNKRPFKFPNLVLKIKNHFKFLTSWKQIRDQMIIHHIPRIKFQSLDVVSCKNSF